MDVFLQALVFLGSAVFGRPLLKPLIVEGLIKQVPAAQRHALQEALEHRGMTRAYWLSGVIAGVWKLMFGGLRMLVAYSVVTAPFGTATFNAQVAVLMTVMYLPGLLMGAIVLAPAMLLVDRTVKRIYGPDVTLMRSEGLHSFARNLTPAT
ncbi:hypothetical protein [Deinococcus deserti]|uniref:Uncharacterized protein n=2 Tax=Deinococcus TaxID=1298 RepID=C1D280_DEIDV|nr:Hypothetical protein; putative membrane protein [Deinococcus deserti VCD115]